ncbi:Peptidyl-prolyl cis-trans isomerase FKBP18, chloroplastic [Coccomyxa sp. Obi]|nr:Peptidyl-prolyl cis-trans isomerase FKBP18, chloroplastic [Coccomyxa sp. Obi]
MQSLALLLSNEAEAIGFTKELKKRKADLSEYATSSDGLKYLDLSVGSGDEVSKGQRVTVHFDCIYKGINVVSSRQARLLGGNRTISEPFEFTAGDAVSGVAAKKISDSANGLFAGSGGPKPPSALGTAVLGMRVGGKRSVIVPPELGYGATGLQEIPPYGTFEMRVEVLQLG